jgi:hypothetical protein
MVHAEMDAMALITPIVGIAKKMDFSMTVGHVLHVMKVAKPARGLLIMNVSHAIYRQQSQDLIRVKFFNALLRNTKLVQVHVLIVLMLVKNA